MVGILHSEIMKGFGMGYFYNGILAHKMSYNNTVVSFA